MSSRDFVTEYLRERYPGASDDFIQKKLDRLGEMSARAGKTCRVCGKHQPFSAYGIDVSKLDGRMAVCRTCRR